jgi:hypothetical protein
MRNTDRTLPSAAQAARKSVCVCASRALSDVDLIAHIALRFLPE